MELLQVFDINKNALNDNLHLQNDEVESVSWL